MWFNTWASYGSVLTLLLGHYVCREYTNRKGV
jgi:hypothetical protein